MESINEIENMPKKTPTGKEVPAPKFVCYVGDVHGSDDFPDFVKRTVSKYPDVKFVTLGDYFDRGFASARVAETLIKLRSEGRLDVPVFGNHDAFFLYGSKLIDKVGISLDGKGNFMKIQELMKTAEALLRMNGGEATEDSFRSSAKAAKTATTFAKFIAKKGRVFVKVPETGALAVHGGIPIWTDGTPFVFPAKDGRLVMDGGEYDSTLSGMGVLEACDEGFRNGELWAASFLTGLRPENVFLMRVAELTAEASGGKSDPRDIYGALTEDHPRHIVPTWYDNSLYDSNPKVAGTLRKLLDDAGFDHIACGHWRNDPETAEGYA